MTTYDLASVDAAISGVTYNLAALDVITGGLTYDLAALDVYAGSDFQVSLGPNPPRFDPFDIAVLTASSLIVPDTWTFAQIDSLGGSVITPTVTLTGSGGTRSYRCPGRLTEQTLFFRCTATKDSATSVAEVTHTVAPHAGVYGPNGVGWQYHPTQGA